MVNNSLIQPRGLFRSSLPAFSISGVKEATSQNSTPVHATAWEWKNDARCAAARAGSSIVAKTGMAVPEEKLPSLRDGSDA
jgi:hypothetical protein